MGNNKGGRPPHFETPEDLQKEIDKYLKNCPDKKVIVTKKGDKIEIPTPTISGLCYYLGFESRQSFYDYEKKDGDIEDSESSNKLGFSYTIKRARLFIEKEYESLLSTNAYAGAIFALKNFGWVDKTQQEITNKTPQIVVASQSDADILKRIADVKPDENVL